MARGSRGRAVASAGMVVGAGDRVARERELLPAEWCARLGLPDGATYADGAEVFLGAFAGQTSVPWPYDFPRKAGFPLIRQSATCIRSRQTTAPFNRDSSTDSAAPASGCSGGEASSGSARSRSAICLAGNGLLNRKPCISSQA